MNLVSQAIEGVRVMKMSGWENELQKRILAARAKEIHQIHKANRCKAANEGMFFITYGVVSTIIFIFHVFVFGGTLVTKDVFTIFSLISVMQLEMTKHLSLGVYVSLLCRSGNSLICFSSAVLNLSFHFSDQACAELWISVSRIQKFLETPGRYHAFCIDGKIIDLAVSRLEPGILTQAIFSMGSMAGNFVIL
jgi:hypothetical protein